MGKRVLLAIAMMLVGGMAFAEHAISLEPDTAPAVASEPAMAPTAAPEASATVPTIAQAPQPAPQASPQVQVTLPSELDVYLVPAATHEVCMTSAWGYGEVRTDCRTQPVPVRRDDPALSGICTTYYGRRTCY